MYPDSPWLVATVDGLTEDPAPTGDFAELLLRRFLGLCERQRTRSTMLRMIKASMSNAGTGRRFYSVLNKTVLSPVARATGVRSSALRMELVASQLIGLAMMRYVLEVEPVASADIDVLVQQFAPAVRATLKA